MVSKNDEQNEKNVEFSYMDRYELPYRMDKKSLC